MTLLDSYIIVGDESLPETLYSPDELYALMRKGVKVRTAQASVFERHQHYESILSRYGRALYLCVGSVYTGNYQAVSAWKSQSDPTDRLTVIDTGLASGRLGIAALATARYAARVDHAEKVVRFARAAVRKSEEYIFLDRLQYLVAGGRLSKTKGFFGDMLHLKPIITPTAEGAVKAGKARNQNEQLEFAMEKLKSGLVQDVGSLIMLEYSDNRPWVEDKVLGKIKDRHPDGRGHLPAPFPDFGRPYGAGYLGGGLFAVTLSGNGLSDTYPFWAPHGIADRFQRPTDQQDGAIAPINARQDPKEKVLGGHPCLQP